MPLQGALNFIVYVRPRVAAWKAHYTKSKSRQEHNRRHRANQAQSDPCDTVETDVMVSKLEGELSEAELPIPPLRILVYKAVFEEVPSSRQPRRGRRPGNTNNKHQFTCPDKQTASDGPMIIVSSVVESNGEDGNVVSLHHIPSSMLSFEDEEGQVETRSPQQEPAQSLSSLTPSKHNEPDETANPTTTDEGDNDDSIGHSDESVDQT